MSNINLDEKQMKLFARLARKNPKIIENIRKVYLDNELDNVDPYDYMDLIEARIKKDVDKMSNKEMIDYWIDFYDADAGIIPEAIIKKLNPKEKDLLDIE
jgi:hypothetical protein